MDLGLLILRLVAGTILAAHGAQKLFGWFGGYGIAGTGGFMESLGFRPGKPFAVAAGFSELAGGVLIALGLFGPIGPALILATMIVATLVVHWKHGLFSSNNGIELTFLYAVISVTLALTGFGAFSVDALLQIEFSPAVVWGALFAGVAGGVANLAVRQRQTAGVAREV